MANVLALDPERGFVGDLRKYFATAISRGSMLPAIYCLLYSSYVSHVQQTKEQGDQLHATTVPSPQQQCYYQPGQDRHAAQLADQYFHLFF